MAGKLIQQTNVTLDILEEQRIKVGSKWIDLSKHLDKYQSKEYRVKDIEKINITEKEKTNSCRIHIIDCGSGDVPFLDDYKDTKVCVLNFASSKHPGGGFMTGAKAQEEDLCYHSNLYPALCEHKKFYEYNRNHLENCLYTDGIIYIDNVCFFRYHFKNMEPVFVNVITCPAPNKGQALKCGVKSSIIDETMTRRLEQIMKVAIENNNRTLVLGAFGCGVFKNDINYVAMEIKKLLANKGYIKYFDNIVIPTLDKGKTYEVFKNTFRGLPNLVIG